MTHLSRPCSTRVRRSWRTVVAGLGLGCVFASTTAQPLEAQIPDSFTNLQFFDANTSRSELIGAMRKLSFALDVRCQYCHEGGDGVAFDSVDFASDAKPVKRRARYMLEMTETINSTLLTSVPGRQTPNIQVECRTCHRGLTRPEMIDDLLRRRIAEEGVDAAVREYRELRQEEYGGWSYDFGAWAVYDLAAEYQDENPEISVELIKLNTEFFSESAGAWIALGQAELASGNRDAAIRAFRQGLEVSPDNERILRLLQELGG